MWSQEGVPTSSTSFSKSGGGCYAPDAVPASSFSIINNLGRASEVTSLN